MGKLIAIGETLIDFMPDKEGKLRGIDNFKKCPGGAPGNVAGCTARLGSRAVIITKLGMDPFGDYLKECLLSTGIDTSAVSYTDKANTALAFVSNDSSGDRDFLFYRSPSADMLLSPEDVPEALFEKDDILHFCSVALVDAPCRKAHDRAIEIAKAKGCLISFDVNLRFALWPDNEELKKTVLHYAPYADIIKAGEDELEFLGELNPPSLIITKGKNGASWRDKAFGEIVKDGYPTPAVDTTGAGDAFIGAIIHQLLKRGKRPTELMSGEVSEILMFAHAVSSVVVSVKGGMNAMPDMETVEAFMKKYGNI